MKFEDQQFADEPIRLDGNEFVRCRFERCQLTYAGGPVPTLAECQFVDVNWQFSEAAANTLQFLRGLFHGGGAGGQALVEHTFRNLTMKTDQSAAQPKRGKPHLRVVRDDET